MKMIYISTVRVTNKKRYFDLKQRELRPEGVSYAGMACIKDPEKCFNQRLTLIREFVLQSAWITLTIFIF